MDSPLCSPLCSTAAVLTIAVISGSAAAQSGNQHVDVNPYDSNGTDPGGQILTGFFDFDSNTFTEDSFRFSEPLEIVQPTFHGVSAPGFFASANFSLLPSADLSFDIPAVSDPISGTPSTLFYWDGVDDDGNGDYLEDVDFAAPPAGHSLQVRLSTFVNTTVAGETTDQPGFVIDRTNSTGGLHKHVSYLVQGDAGQAPDDGLYLLPFRLHQPGLDSSDPFFLLFNGKYERDGNDAIIFDGILPRTNPDAQAAAEAWLDALFAVGVAGDYNGSGLVEQGDLDLVLLNWGVDTDAVGDPAGWTHDLPVGLIDQGELDAVLLNWGDTAEPNASGAAVPEPGTALLLLPAAGVVAGYRRRRAYARTRPVAACAGPPRRAGGHPWWAR